MFEFKVNFFIFEGKYMVILSNILLLYLFVCFNLMFNKSNFLIIILFFIIVFLKKSGFILYKFGLGGMYIFCFDFV